MDFTRQHVEHAVKRAHHFQGKFESIREKLEGVTQGTVETLEVSAGALLGGVIDGRMGKGSLPTIMHVPITLGAGIVLNVLGHFNVAGKQYSAHWCNVGNGFLANYLSHVGFQFGKNWQDRGSLFSKKSTAALPAAAAGSLGEDQMAQILQRLQQAQGQGQHAGG